MRLKSRRRPRVGYRQRHHRRGPRIQFSKLFIACHAGNDSDTDVDDIQQNDGLVQQRHLGCNTGTRYEVRHYEEMESRISFSSDEECLIAGETRALVAPPGDGFTQMRSSAHAISSIKMPHEDTPHTEPTSHGEASATRPWQTEPNYSHSGMEALLDADLSDDEVDTPRFHGNDTANHPLTGNGLDHVVFSFQRQFLLSNPRRQNWPWSAAVGGPTNTETDPAPGLQTMFHESSSGRRHLSSSSAKTVSMPHREESSLNALASPEETNLQKFDKTFPCASMRDSKADSDMFETFSTAELFGVASVCDITDDETSEVAMNLCSTKTTQLVDRTTSSRSKMPVQPSTSCEIENKAFKDSDVDYGDDIRAMFDDAHNGDAEYDSVSSQEVGTSHKLPTDSGELKSVYSNESDLTNGTGSDSPLNFPEVFPDFSGTEAVAELDYDVISIHDSTDLPNAAETFHEHLRHEWNNVCMTDSSVDSDSDTEDLDNTTDTIETYLTDSSESLELNTRASNASEESISLDATDLENLFASPDDSAALSSRDTDNDNINVSDVSMSDRNSTISLQSVATTNSDSLVNENTRVLFMMTDNDRRPPVRWSHRYQSPMGSVNSDSLINGQNRDLFTSGNWDDQAVDNSQHTQNDASPSDSTADDWYVYDERLTAELNSRRHLVDMHNYLRTQQRGIVGLPPYEECTVAPPAEDVAGVSQTEETAPETLLGPPPPYTEHTHTESPPPDYDQLSDHTVENVQPGSLAMLFQPTSAESNDRNEQEDQLDNDLEDHPADCRTNNAVIDELTDDGAMLDLGTEAQCQSGSHDRMPSMRSNPPSYHHPVFSLGHHLPLRWNTTAGVNQWASSQMWASFRMPS